jgi:hypothetical protein
MRWRRLLFLSAFVPGLAFAQDYTVGATGWQVERVSNTFVVLRADINRASGKQERQGLLVLTCDPQARRIRFQIGRVPGQPSLESDQTGRATIRGRSADNSIIAPFHAPVRFFPDGSFEVLEAIGFTTATMQSFVTLLEALPSAVEIVLYRGPETGAFVQGTTLRLKLDQLEANLVGLYGFEGLCYRGMSTQNPQFGSQPGDRVGAQTAAAPRLSRSP